MKSYKLAVLAVLVAIVSSVAGNLELGVLWLIFAQLISPDSEAPR